MQQFIKPNWTAPSNIKAIITTRMSGVSKKPFASFNLGDHVGDNRKDVEYNRFILQHQLNLPSEPVWLRQQHGVGIINLDNEDGHSTNLLADGSVTFSTGIVCAILTADCLPILLYDQASKGISAIHAGWKGLFKGIIPNAIKLFKRDPTKLLAWLGPCISIEHYQVSVELYQQFIQCNSEYGMAFIKSGKNIYCDLQQIARIQLSTLGINNIFSSSYCTYQQQALFYSHRRDGTTGRFASLIWKE